MNDLKSTIKPLKSLILEMNLIGYEEMGESIVFFIKCDGRIIYSGAIDCYEENSINKTIDILQKEKIKVLNMICWTHPDKDHSKGLEKIIDLRDKNTHIILPEGIDNKLAVQNYSSEAIAVLEKINNIYRERKEQNKKSFPNIDYVANVTDDIFLKNYYYKGKVKEIRIKTLSPVSKVMKSRFLIGDELLTLNELSVCMSIKIGDFNILLTGDLENTTINNMSLSELDKIFDIIKIPHHGSNGSLALLNKIDKTQKIALSCSTTFKANKIPTKRTIDEYYKYSDNLLLTQPYNRKYEGYGVINIKADILNNHIYSNTLGNAKKIQYDEKIKKYINL